MKLKKISFKIPPGLFNTVYNLPVWQKLAILLATWAVPLVLFWLLFLSPRLGEMDTMSSRLPKLRAEIITLEAKAKQIPKLNQELEIMQAILQKAMKLLPEKKDIPSVLTEISSIGNAERLEFLSFKPQPEQMRTFYAAIPVVMEFKGPFHNVVGFFDRVSRMGRIVHLKEISMGNAKESRQVWSQTGNNPGNDISSQSAPTESEMQTGKNNNPVMRRFVIKTVCKVETYRFLTPEEQEARKKDKKNKKKRRRR